MRVADANFSAGVIWEPLLGGGLEEAEGFSLRHSAADATARMEANLSGSALGEVVAKHVDGDAINDAIGFSHVAESERDGGGSRVGHIRNFDNRTAQQGRAVSGNQTVFAAAWSQRYSPVVALNARIRPMV